MNIGDSTKIFNSVVKLEYMGTKSKNIKNQNCLKKCLREEDLWNVLRERCLLDLRF